MLRLYIYMYCDRQMVLTVNNSATPNNQLVGCRTLAEDRTKPIATVPYCPPNTPYEGY